MPHEDSDSASGDNYTLETELSAEDAGEFVEVEVAQLIDQTPIFGTDVNFTYDIEPSLAQVGDIQSDVETAAVNSLASVVSDQVGVPRRVATSFIEDRLSDGQVVDQQDIDPLAVTVDVEGPGRPSELSDTVPLPKVVTVSVPDEVDLPDVQSRLEDRGVNGSIDIRFTTRPENQSGDWVPELGADEVTTEVSIPHSMFVEVVEVDETPGGPDRPEGPGEPGDIRVEDIGLPSSPPRPGESLEFEYTATNTGDKEASRDIVYSLGGANPRVSSVSLGPGETSTETEKITIPSYLTDSTTLDVGNESVDLSPEAPDPASFEISDIASPGEVEAGGPLDVGVTVRNTGDEAGEAVVSLLGRERSGRVEPGETRTFDLTPTVGSGVTEAPEVNVEDADTGDVTTRGVPTSIAEPPEPPQFQLSELDAPGTVEPGGVLDIVPTVRNTGDEPGEVIVTAAGRSESATVSPGDRRDVELGLPAAESLEPPVTVTVENADTGETVATRSVGFSMPGDDPSGRPTPDPRPDPSPDPSPTPPEETGDPSFSIVSVDSPSSAPRGDRLPLSVEVENTGDAAGAVTVEVNPSRTVELSPGESRTVDFDLPVDPSGSSFSPEVRLINEETGETDGRTRETIDIERPKFEIGQPQTPDLLAPGETGTVSVPVRNTGRAEGSVSVTVGDETYDVTVPPGGERMVEHRVSSRDLPGSGSLTVSAENADTGDAVGTTRARVEAGESAFEIGNIQLPQTARPGQVVSGRAEVANTGEVDGTARVEAGDSVQTVSIPSESTRQVPFRVQKTPDQFQRVRVTVTDPESGETVSQSTRQLGLIDSQDGSSGDSEEEDDGLIPSEITDALPAPEEVVSELPDPLGILD